ncbi:hypothetical protein GGQ99_005111 [Aminobacter niigataensis]|uniref:Uncharacterized protein n=1 Tax=Aminobacter niigataensis TaxID=83265 RepID=A0ABR6L921_9HYPH|nr:hypothetical protein [Aminobacter niigataensis]MBB4653321.1 hypothetical protein [Aminobacter niigataensis]
MKTELYNMALEGAAAEGKRFREQIEREGRDRPIDACPGENERYWLEIDFRDGDVSVNNSWGSGTPAWIWEGKGVRFPLKSSCSQLAIANLLESRPDLVAEVAIAEGDEAFRDHEILETAISDLANYWVMGPEEWFRGFIPRGDETDEQLHDMTDGREWLGSGFDGAIYLTFSKDEAFEWLKQRRDEARAELNEAA